MVKEFMGSKEKAGHAEGSSKVGCGLVWVALTLAFGVSCQPSASSIA